MEMTKQEANYHHMEDWREEPLVKGQTYVKINGHWVLDDPQEIQEAVACLSDTLRIAY